MEHEDSNGTANNEGIYGKVKIALRYRLFFLLYEGGHRSFTPYFPIMIKQRGFSPESYGIIRTLMKISGVVSRPITTYIGDRYRIHKLILIASLMTSIASYVGIAALSPSIRDETCSNLSNLSSNQSNIHNGFDEKYVNVSTSASKSTCPAYVNHINASGKSFNSDSSCLDHLNWMYDASQLFRLFVIYCIIAMVADMFPTRPLLNAAVIDSLGKNKENYGWHRAFGAIGCIIG